MKRLHISIFLLFSFLAFTNTAFAQTLDNTKINDCGTPPNCQEVPICTLVDDCFKFDLFAPKDQGDGTSVIKIKITNFSESTFKQAAFELPGLGTATKPAIAPKLKFRNRYNHDVINPANDSMLVFNARNAGTFSYGGFEVYYYVVRNADLNAPSGRNILVKAHAGREWQLQRFGTVSFNIDECQAACPKTSSACFAENCLYRIDYLGTETVEESYAPVFEITNLSAANSITSVTFTTLGSTAASTPAGFYDGVPARDFNVTPAPSLITYDMPDPAWVEQGAFVDFFYSIPKNTVAVVNPDGTITLKAGNNVTITITGTAGTLIHTFQIATNDPNNQDECLIIPLPVELMGFEGKLSGEDIALSWKTATEENNDRFEIERSSNGRDFEKIGTVKGSGNSSAQLDYGYLDKDPGQGINYYRLKQVDTDGTATHSHIVKVNTNNKGTGQVVQLIPNPCNGESCTVHLKGFTNANSLTVELRDLTGRMVFSKQINGDQTSFELPRINTGNGVYILSARDGKHTTFQKVVIQ